MRRSQKRILFLVYTLAIFGFGSVTDLAHAYSVSTGVSDPCHELMTDLADKDAVFEIVPVDLVVPSGGNWSELSDFFLDSLNTDPSQLDEVARFLLTSLIVGVRSPDTDGHSVMNIENLHLLHGDPSAKGQYAHALRGPEDDYAGGDAAAVTGTRQLILELVGEGQRYLSLPSAEQLVSAPVFLDFYGRIQVKVWAPLYYVGRAAHALQDTFSHTIRSDQDDLKKIVHVLNYVDAISSDFDEDRDGLAHADSMDKCLSNDMADLYAVSIEATTDLLVGVRDQFHAQDPEAVLGVLDKWVTYKPGCALANGFCGNERWLAVARKEQTGPYVAGILGCSTAGVGRRGPGGESLLFFVLVVGLAGLRRRFWSRRRS